MATAKISPPTFSKSKSYELYKQELSAWNEITEIDKKKRGIAIALTLPENDESQIREKVFDQLQLDDLKKDDGLETLIKFLDKHLAKDDLADSLDKFEDFEDFSRSEGQSVIEYIAMFDNKYRKIEKKGMKLPSEILAFKLLRKAKITKEEKMLVLTGMNYENKATLYEEAKCSLKKFKGEGGQSKSASPSIKLEPAFLAENEEALMAAGYVRRGSTNFGYRRGRPYRGRGQNFGFSSSQRGTKNINPNGPDGKIMTCRSCGSYRHLVKNCPDSWENLQQANITENEEHVVLFTGYQKQDLVQLGTDARNCAVLDSACSSTVCGQTWLKSYIDSLNKTDRAKIVNRDGQRVFKFGGGTKLKSEGEYELPVHIVGKPVTIKTDVVNSDIPLLLSRTAMKNAGVKMNLENDTAVILGKEVALNLTASGHYCIPIDKTQTLPVNEVNAVKLEELSDDKRKSTLLKLHRQFAHPPKKRLVALLKDAGTWREEYDNDLTDIYAKCNLCKMYAVTPPRPVVSLPMATQFNEKVAIDLKQYKQRWILHMIDMWSRYTMSVFIDRKKPSNVVDVLMKNWVGIFGVMGSLMSDNGGEFNADEIREIASILNVKLHTTAGMSPYQNGLCERVHAVTDSMLVKLEAENKNVDIETLLSWANMARNSLQMWNGYSSHQLVFGRNPNLPNLLTNSGPPALVGTTSSENFAKHLNALHETRKAYIQTEADERLRRALRSKIRAAEQVYENGDLVFYKRDGKERWLGPGKVVFQDSKVVFIRHGGIYVRVSPNRLCKIDSHSISDNENKATSKSEIEFPKINKPEKSENKYDEHEISPKTNVISEIIGSTKEVQNAIGGNEAGNIEIQSTDHDKSIRLKPNDKIKFKLSDTNEWVEATIISKAGKTTGKNKNWYNIEKHSDDHERLSVNLEKLEWENLGSNQVQINYEDLNETEEVNQINDIDNDETFIAKQSELDKLKLFDTYEEVEFCGQKTISTRWVITSKNGTMKARLVARGFEEHSFIPKDSPTVGKGTIRTFLAITASEKWTIKTTDIKSAFLQGKQLDRNVFITPPVESNTPLDYIWKLKHGLYGLKDGARQFYISVKEELINLGFIQSKLDPAMFILRDTQDIHGIICCHVDDFLHAGNEFFETKIKKLRQRFLAGKIEEGTFKYIGFEVKQTEHGIVLDHSKYMNSLDHPNIEPKRAYQKEKQLTVVEQKTYRKLIGQLNWAVQGSRPDLAFELIDLSTKLKIANITDLLRAIKNIGKLKDLQPVQFFPQLQGNPKSDWEFFTFTDAALGNINDGKGSTGAHIIWIKDRTGNCCALWWQANKIKRVVRSTIAAEALSLQEGLESALYYRQTLEDIFGIEKDSLPITAFIDNKSVTEALKSTKLVDDKRLRLDIASIREMTQNNNIQVKWCPGKSQLANSMTKRGASGLELMSMLQRGRIPEEFM